MKKFAVVWMVSLFLVIPVTVSLAAGSRAPDVTVEQARELIRGRGGQADFVVLDVRTPGEFAGGHLPGAVNVDIQAYDFGTRLGALDRKKTYLVYCRSGNRSTKAVQAMERLEFVSVYHMFEGSMGWEKKGKR